MLRLQLVTNCCQHGSGILPGASVSRDFSSNDLNAEYGSPTNSSTRMPDMMTVRAGLPVGSLIDRRGSGIAKASRLAPCGLYVDCSGRRIPARRICSSPLYPNEKEFGKLSWKERTVGRNSDSVAGRVISLHSESSLQVRSARALWSSKILSINYRARTPNLADKRLKIRVSERWKVVHITRASISTASTSLGEQGDGAASSQPVVDFQQQAKNSPLLAGWKPPRYVWRSVACVIIAGQVLMRVIKGKIHVRNSVQQLSSVGPGSLGVSLLTASFVGMVFTIQFVREFARLGLTRSVGGVLALALARELSPVVTAIILAGRVGSAFAAELGTMQVSEQTDTLRVLRTDPIDYLITPRVLACCISLPILTIICFSVGMAASVLLADSVYHVSSNIILESAAKALQPWDLISTSIKSVVFGGIIAIISCAWGLTTSGGAKGVGESTTSAVVISLVCIFIADFILSWCFFQGAGDALKAAMG